VTGTPLPVDPGLLSRFRSAGDRIAWRAASGRSRPRPVRRARIAHLHDEDARVEAWGRAPRGGLEVDSGPLGALVLLLEADRRGVLPTLTAREAGVDRRFPQGAIAASWDVPAISGRGPTVRDLVELARYALA
jgi:hypothetical protein